MLVFLQVGDNPKETLYQCFLVDIGRHEQIPKSSIRTLPHDLKMRPSYAIQCTLNGISKWSLESTASFKDWIAFSSRIHIKVLAKEEDHLHVDLFRPEKGDRMVSVMDSVMKAQRPTQQPVTLEKAAQIKTFKPKFGELESKSKLPKHSSVFVTKATTPKDIFIQFQDEDYQLYCKMQERLQREFSTAQSATLCSSPLIGILNLFLLIFNVRIISYFLIFRSCLRRPIGYQMVPRLHRKDGTYNRGVLRRHRAPTTYPSKYGVSQSLQQVNQAKF